ncbi:MAG: ABC transporter ATP-binding protein [Verrucomicrobiota bacterium]
MILAENLTKDYGAFRAVNQVSFEVKPGDILGFLGPNGAGKSTTMKMLTGFLRPSSGKAFISGKNVGTNAKAAKSQLGYLPETGPLYPEMTVHEFLSFTAEMRGLAQVQKSSSVDKAIETCHLHGVVYQTLDTLSKGYRQRVGLAQAILHNPPCLILDEPTDGLDPNQKDEVRKLISGMAQDKAIILSTHILEEVSAMCNRVIIIDRGVVKVDATPQELLKKHPRFNELTVNGEEDSLKSFETAIQGVEWIQKVSRPTKRKLVLSPTKGQNIQAKVLGISSEKGIALDSIELARPRLEDVFRSMTQKNAA